MSKKIRSVDPDICSAQETRPRTFTNPSVGLEQALADKNIIHNSIVKKEGFFPVRYQMAMHESHFLPSYYYMRYSELPVGEIHKNLTSRKSP